MTKSGKHCGKRRNCLFLNISSFVTLFSKSFLLQRSQKVSIWGKGLNSLNVWTADLKTSIAKIWKIWKYWIIILSNFSFDHKVFEKCLLHCVKMCLPDCFIITKIRFICADDYLSKELLSRTFYVQCHRLVPITFIKLSILLTCWYFSLETLYSPCLTWCLNRLLLWK